jgi:acyl CoA:acetate/3-ketoacid CoA transferase alpha subunit
MTGKVVRLEEAVAVVGDGAHVALTGFAITRNAIAISHALIRSGRRGLHVSQVIGGMETDLLVGAGCVERLTYSGGSLDRFGPLHAVNRGIGHGSVAVAEYSSLALTLRFHAAALGLPYAPARSMLGSDLLGPLLTSGEVRLAADPFEGSPIVQLSPLHPDVAFVHADIADEAGNAAVGGPTWALRESAFAARSVMVVCEEVVPVGSIDPDAVVIPATIVDAVAVVPNGAHPTAVYQRYDFDRTHLQNYAAASLEGADAHAAYLDKFVHGVPDHAAYVDLVGAST